MCLQLGVADGHDDLQLVDYIRTDFICIWPLSLQLTQQLGSLLLVEDVLIRKFKEELQEHVQTGVVEAVQYIRVFHLAHEGL